MLLLLLLFEWENVLLASKYIPFHLFSFNSDHFSNLFERRSSEFPPKYLSFFIVFQYPIFCVQLFGYSTLYIQSISSKKSIFFFTKHYQAAILDSKDLKLEKSFARQLLLQVRVGSDFFFLKFLILS